MKLNRRLILIICGFLSFCLFQNFEMPNFEQVKEQKFVSYETDPLRRLGEYIHFKMSDDMKENIKSLEDNFEWRPNRPTEVAEEPKPQRGIASVEEPKVTDKPMRYSLININTFRVKDDANQIDCRVESRGVNVRWQRKISSVSSYSIEHNTAENKSNAHIHWDW